MAHGGKYSVSDKWMEPTLLTDVSEEISDPSCGSSTWPQSRRSRSSTKGVWVERKDYIYTVLVDTKDGERGGFIAESDVHNGKQQM